MSGIVSGIVSGICTSLPSHCCVWGGNEKGTSMKGTSYRDRDYAFGQAMLTLRTTIRLTQAGLAKRLRISRKAVGLWEAGLAYPKTEHLKAFIALAVEHQTWPFGHTEKEIRALWYAAHQKVPLDEAWVTVLLSHVEVSPTSQPAQQTIDVAQTLASPAREGPRVDWG